MDLGTKPRGAHTDTHRPLGSSTLTNASPSFHTTQAADREEALRSLPSSGKARRGTHPKRAGDTPEHHSREEKGYRRVSTSFSSSVSAQETRGQEGPTGAACRPPFGVTRKRVSVVPWKLQEVSPWGYLAGMNKAWPHENTPQSPRHTRSRSQGRTDRQGQEGGAGSKCQAWELWARALQHTLTKVPCGLLSEDPGCHS